MRGMRPKNSQFYVELASSKDIEIIWKLENNIFRKDDRFSKRQLRYLLSSPNAKLFLCHRSGNCVGYGVSIVTRLKNGKKKGRIYSIGLLADHRRKGGGSELLNTLEGQLRLAGVSFITLETKKGPIGASRFFRRKGYVQTMYLPQYYASAHGIRMKKDIEIRRPDL